MTLEEFMKEGAGYEENVLDKNLWSHPLELWGLTEAPSSDE